MSLGGVRRDFSVSFVVYRLSPNEENKANGACPLWYKNRDTQSVTQLAHEKILVQRKINFKHRPVKSVVAELPKH